MPTHVMSCFRLPKTVTKKLTSVVSHFWWSGSGNKKGLHWFSWDKMCIDKKEDGIGFRDIQNFNTALLAKQLWRLIDKPKSLFAKVFKGRYYRKSDPMDPIRSYSPSYGWRSITSARSLVKKGLIKRVGTGSSISVWNDPWIPAQRPRSAIQKLQNQYLNPLLKVEDLINPVDLSWNLDLLNAYVHKDDVSIIRSLAISRNPKPDSYGWLFTDHGRYTVKSGYRTEILYPDLGSRHSDMGPNVKPLLAHAWKLQCSPKLQHFVWQIISGSLPVTKNLRFRGIKCDLQCHICGAEEESINHVLFECPIARQTWALSNIPSRPGVFPTQSLFTNMDYLFWRLPKEPDLTYFPWILWYIWKNRNAKIFNNKIGSPPQFLRTAEIEGTLWAEAQIKEGINRGSSFGGSPNLQGVNRCYVDGAWKEQDPFTGQGWFYRNERSTDTMMGAMSIRRSLSPLHAECEALIWAMECMKTLHISEVVFATDCSQLVKMVSTPTEWPAFTTHMEEFLRCKEYFSTFTIQHIPRAQNTMADKLARGARTQPSAMVYVDSDLPRWFSAQEST